MYLASNKIRRHKDRNRSSRLRAKLRNKQRNRVKRMLKL